MANNENGRRQRPVKGGSECQNVGQMEGVPTNGRTSLQEATLEFVVAAGELFLARLSSKNLAQA